MKKLPFCIVLFVAMLIGCQKSESPNSLKNFEIAPKDLKNATDTFFCKDKTLLSHINFYGNRKENWVAVIFGYKKQDIAMITIEPSDFPTVLGTFKLFYVFTENGWQKTFGIPKEKLKQYIADLNLSEAEKEFVVGCAIVIEIKMQRHPQYQKLLPVF